MKRIILAICIPLAVIIVMAFVNNKKTDVMLPPVRKDSIASVKAFGDVYKVLMSSRCMNCHPSGDIPLQGDNSILHTMSPKRGIDGKGVYAMKCSNCHQSENTPGLHTPPGNPNWHLPPSNMRMVFQGRTPRQLAKQLVDFNQNGHKDMKKLIEHADDGLVLAGWNPGEGRTLPPLSHAAFKKAWLTWLNTGAYAPKKIILIAINMSVQEKDSLSRRGFLKIAGISGTALCLGLYMSSEAEAKIVDQEHAAAVSDIELAAWIIINTSGKVTLICHRAEMGQGVYHSIAQIIAEELEVDLYGVEIQLTQGDEKKYGSQLTGGSSTIRGSYKNLLKLSATAREVLIMAAAARWDAPATQCYAELGHVIHKPSGKKFHYGELVAAASKLTAPKDVKLKARADYKLIGKPSHRRDSPLKTNGEAIFGIDKRIPGLQFAAVERNPRLRGKVKSFDASATLKVPGVTRVFKVVMGIWNIDREGVAVIANSTWAAMQGKKALIVQWDDSGFDHVSTPEIYKQQLELLQTSEGLTLKTQGDPNGIIAAADNKLDVIYKTPYQSHSCMEPVNCIAHWQGDKVEIWGPVQAPNWIQDYISQKMGLAREKVTVNMTFLGGGFGRKAMPDYPHEACVISKELGAPVQVVWSREDDATQGPFRPGISYRGEGVIENGAISAIKFRMAGQNNDHWRNGDNGKPNRSTTEGFLAPYFASIENISFADVPFKTPVPTSFWRSVYASTNGFAYESFMDELAHKALKDPLVFRREYLKDERSQKLIDKMENVSGWKNRKENSGYGVAITECFSSTVGHIVKVSKKGTSGIRIDKVWVVVDCGWYVNPDIIKAQVEGSVVMALGAATTHEITFKDGMVEQRNFYDYKMPRINDIPLIEVYIMENDENAGGMGEPGLPAFAPALTNAIFDLTGKRIRNLPFNLDKIRMA